MWSRILSFPSKYKLLLSNLWVASAFRLPSHMSHGPQDTWATCCIVCSPPLCGTDVPPTHCTAMAHLHQLDLPDVSHSVGPPMQDPLALSHDGHLPPPTCCTSIPGPLQVSWPSAASAPQATPPKAQTDSRSWGRKEKHRDLDNTGESSAQIGNLGAAG